MTETAIPETPGLPPEPPPPPGSNWALFLDIDGTLLDIAETPDQVRVPPALRNDLDLAASQLEGALALVSGRPVSDIDRLFDPLRLPASGQHGGEWRPVPQQATEVIAGQTVPPNLRAVADGLLRLHPGIVVEQKSHAIAVHYRHAPDLGPELGARLAEAMAGIDGLQLLSGRSVWEVKDSSQSKGTAVQRFMARPGFAGRLPVFVGDDTTDLDGFLAVEALGGLALPVGPLVRSGKPGFADPVAVRAWLAEFAAVSNGAAR